MANFAPKQPAAKQAAPAQGYAQAVPGRRDTQALAVDEGRSVAGHGHSFADIHVHSPAQPTLQRVVEVRPPGRGEASAFERRQELIDRMNAISGALEWSLDGRTLRYEVVDEAAQTNFDQQMRGFVDRAKLVPMRLITSSGLVGGGPLLVDSLQLGYLDLDDMLAGSDVSFQMNLIHLLEERFRVRNYARRLGTDMSADFDRAHRAGLNAEAAFLQDLLSDPTVRFLYEETRPNGTNVFGFKSDEGYRVFHVFRRSGRQERGGTVFVNRADGTRVSIEDFVAERQAEAAEEEAEPAAAP